jgi:hypothetical protein
VPTVVFCQVAGIGLSRGYVLLLEFRWCRVRLVQCDLLVRGGLMLNAVGAAVESDVVGVDNGGLFNDGPIDVDVSYHIHIHVDDRGVVSENTAIPRAACKTNTHKAAAVVHAAVKADVRSPVA